MSLMVSARAVSSSCRSFCSASHSPSFVPQFLARSARNFWSDASDSEVSSRSFFIVSVLTPSSPTRFSFCSIVLDRAATCFFLAPTIASKSLLAPSSSATASPFSFSISSFIAFTMPRISPLPAEPSLPERKERISWRVASGRSAFSIAYWRTMFEALVCRKAPAMPFSRAETAFVRAAMFVSDSALNAANAAASFSRIAVASLRSLARSLRSSDRSSISCVSESFFASRDCISAFSFCNCALRNWTS
mmetsp:Transcript_69084/g.202776  ORF Transcript_69084/g.202776 Transcript_69084/m.202776 type:complete len:248 (-) Transcript_69084:49-792(-)